MNVLVLVGSLRAGSTNAQLADAAIAHLPAGVDGTVFARLADLPHYSEDLDHDDHLPQVARDLREAVADADARAARDARVQRLDVERRQERRRLGLATARCGRHRRQARRRHRRHRVAPRRAQWAREDGVKVLKVAGADVIEDTVGIGSAFQAFVDGRLSDAGPRRRPARPDGPAGSARSRAPAPPPDPGSFRVPTQWGAMTPGPDARRLASTSRRCWRSTATTCGTPTPPPLAPQAPYLVESAHGIRLRLRDRDGEAREVIDAMSSWWCAIHGYAVPELDAAAQRQLELDGARDVRWPDPRARPSASPRRLLDLAPDGLERVPLADSGSVSVEVAMKMALQWHTRGRSAAAAGFFTVRGGYHGDTFSPMSVTDPVSGMHALFRGVLPEHVFAPRPPGGARPHSPTTPSWSLGSARPGRCMPHTPSRSPPSSSSRYLQGAGGLHVYKPARTTPCSARHRRAEHGALVIHDEIATGLPPHRPALGRGEPRRPGSPDILCVGKALTGGYLTLAAVLCTHTGRARGECRRGGRADARPDVHGQPAGLRDRVGEPRPAHLTRPPRGAVRTHRRRVGRRAGARGVPSRWWQEVRVIGAVGVVQLREPVRVAEVTAAALERGVWVRPFRDLVYTMPPYVTSDDELSTITSAVVGAVESAHG